jgi:hypothetical protein
LDGDLPVDLIVRKSGGQGREQSVDARRGFLFFSFLIWQSSCYDQRKWWCGVVYACMHIYEMDKKRLNFSPEREALDKENLLSRRRKKDVDMHREREREASTWAGDTAVDR